MLVVGTADIIADAETERAASKGVKPVIRTYTRTVFELLDSLFIGSSGAIVEFDDVGGCRDTVAILVRRVPSAVGAMISSFIYCDS